ncbi:hypothetical protein AVEN_54340-1 [Araneus ventricosus]|uniref:Uncharacterized protein n=1 Tax=Araneus ventricosus TaxID=182803 RepID=A0A4Y2GDW2_ARAVE|nr:hypothetical protein AVEN_54340-1 [Araneus ventricosus]
MTLLNFPGVRSVLYGCIARTVRDKASDRNLHMCATGNPSIGQYSSVHKDSFSNPPTNRRLEEAVVVNWPRMMKFKAS